MSRIPRHALVSVVVKVRAMEWTQKERFTEELFQEQPHLVGSFLVQQKFGVSQAKMDFYRVGTSRRRLSAFRA